MAWVAVDKDGSEYLYKSQPERNIKLSIWDATYDYMELPEGAIEIILGYKLTWDDEPVELK